jgi:hypothetical protein
MWRSLRRATRVSRMLAATEAGEQSPATSLPEGIAILGSHPATVMKAPFDKNWLIYACSPHNFEKRLLPRFDAWFEVHIPVADKTRADPYLRYVQTLPKVWMRDTEALPRYPGGILYPEDELRGVGEVVQGANGPQTNMLKVGKFSYFHFTSSIAYMMAKAIDDIDNGLAAPCLGLFGIMQASANEYVYQRPGIQYFIDQCWRRGIKTVAPDISRLFESPPENF